MKDLITIGLPSKGRLKDKAISFFDGRGHKILQSEKERNYFGTIENEPNIKIIFLHAKEIIQRLGDGTLDMGVSGLDLLKESSIVIDATDNWKTMKLVNNYCQSNSIPLLSSSVVGFDIQIALFVNNKKDHLCLECIFPNNNDRELARCETIGILGTAAGLAGLLTAQKTINFLMKFNQNNNFLTLINCKSLSFDHIKIAKNPKCNLIQSKI